MVTDIQESFKANVKELSWMDEETKRVTMEKADAISEFIAYPEWILNATTLDKFYYWVSFFIYIFRVLRQLHSIAKT